MKTTIAGAIDSGSWPGGSAGSRKRDRLPSVARTLPAERLLLALALAKAGAGLAATLTLIARQGPSWLAESNAYGVGHAGPVASMIALGIAAPLVHGPAGWRRALAITWALGASAFADRPLALAGWPAPQWPDWLLALAIPWLVFELVRAAHRALRQNLAGGVALVIAVPVLVAGVAVAASLIDPQITAAAKVAVYPLLIASAATLALLSRR